MALSNQAPYIHELNSACMWDSNPGPSDSESGASTTRPLLELSLNTATLTACQIKTYNSKMILIFDCF